MRAATLTFQLPDDQEAFDDARFGTDWHELVRELDDWLRRALKYNALPEPQFQAYTALRTQLHTLLTERDLLL